MASQIGHILEIITTHPKEITKAAPFGQPCISHYEDGFLVFQFVTHKAAPIKAVQSLSETFREDDFRLLWADEDCFNVGEIHFFDGCETDWYYPDGKEAEALYHLIWDCLGKETICYEETSR